VNKIIFLDFDGVLNTESTVERITVPPWSGIRGLDNEKVVLVSDLAIETGADVVISSSWRYHFDMPDLKQLLVTRGWKANIIGMTPIKLSLDRQDEIAMWMELNGKPDKFLVLDDLYTRYKDNQILTNDVEGFHAGLYERALKILGD